MLTRGRRYEELMPPDRDTAVPPHRERARERERDTEVKCPFCPFLLEHLSRFGHLLSCRPASFSVRRGNGHRAGGEGRERRHTEEPCWRAGSPGNPPPVSGVTALGFSTCSSIYTNPAVTPPRKGDVPEKRPDAFTVFTCDKSLCSDCWRKRVDAELMRLSPCDEMKIG